jgi:hypothetical protein
LKRIHRLREWISIKTKDFPDDNGAVSLAANEPRPESRTET